MTRSAAHSNSNEEFFYLFIFFKRRPNAPLWPLIYSGLYQSAANYHSALCLLALPILGNLVSFLTFISSGSFTQISQVVFQRRARSPSSNNAGEMAEGCLLKRMQESKFQSWRVMDISQRKITQSNNLLLGLFDEYDAKRRCKCNNNQGRYFRYGAHDLQSRCSFIFAVLFSSPDSALDLLNEC